jgi:mono/diheme cytochrome c family protein
MRHGPRVYLSIAFFTSLTVVISPLFATGSQTTSIQASSDRGAAIFRKSCSVCHSMRPKEAKVGPSLYGALREGSGHSERVVRQAIADGKGIMPGFKEKLEPHEIDDLLEYLRTR